MEVMEMVDYIYTDRRRGCLAAFPLSSDSPSARISTARLSLSLIRTVDEKLGWLAKANSSYKINLPLPYRRPPQDVRKTLHRWDSRPPSEIFETGFQARDCGEHSENDYYDLVKYVSSGRLLMDRTPFAYVSTTKRREFRPLVVVSAWGKSIYQYHIRAPGGIRVNKALTDEYTFQNQKEIAFVHGINRAYIVSASTFYCDNSGDLIQSGEVEEKNPYFVL